VAARLLAQHGFRARNLSGGYERWRMWRGTFPAGPEGQRSEDGQEELVAAR
jgi:hypothetical protein